ESTGDVIALRTVSMIEGGDDTIAGDAGVDMIFGGAMNDTIDAGTGNDIVFGDGGEVLQPNGVPVTVRSTDVSIGGDDAISGGLGADMILGGVGIDLIRGDDALPDAGQALVGGPTPGSSAGSGVDGSDTVTGAAGGDAGPGAAIGGGGSDADIILGDNGEILLVAGVANEIRTTNPTIGGSDTISGNLDDDTVLGGAAGDVISGDAGADVLLGDHGELLIGGQLIQTLDPTIGGDDSVSAGSGDDMVIGGTGKDTLAGDSGSDLLFGDHGLIDLSLPQPVNFTSIFTGAADGGDDDVIHGNDAPDTALGAGEIDDDTILGQQGDDQLFGGLGDDDLIGGHNVAGGVDELGLPGSGNDTMDGGAGDDVLAGDNAIVVRRADSLSPLLQVLIGDTLYDASLLPDILGTAQLHPLGVVGRDITILDHDAAVAALGGGVQLFGDDSIAGGAHDDLIFGQLGDDVIQGDGSAANDVVADGFSSVGADDGDDYIEGNGGNDLVFGNLGQDDIIGGSSNLFGLTLQSQRIDGADTLFGGAGLDVAYGTFGDLSAEGHALDADVVVGDNANIFRIVGTNGTASGAFLSFNYDDYSALESIVVRAYDLLDDFEGAGASFGGDDVIHGEAGDDTIAGMLGADVLYGEGQDDNVIGGEGADWMSGGTGQDGMLGDGGQIFTSRNGVAEPLYGIAATSESVISLPGGFTSTTLFESGKLSKSVDLEPFDQGGNDTLYGGLGDDSLHGGAGIDGLSGAEALPGFYADPSSTPVIVYDSSQAVNDFVDFDDEDPAQKILGFGLNFAAFNGDPGNPIDDGDDVLFGDEGNDWLVGGTGADHLYGGYGNDILNLDDNLDTDGGENTSEDFDPYAGGDTALGGGGRDTLLGNSKDDRMFDWVGEYNAYVVPFNPFGKQAISREISPAIEQFFYDISESDGADQTRVGPGLGDPARNGEPFGELGLVTHEDDDWKAQTGGPDDPQQGGGGTEDPGEDPLPSQIIGGVYVVEYLDEPNAEPPVIVSGGGQVTGVRGDAGIGGETSLGGEPSSTTSGADGDSSLLIEGLETLGTADDADTDVIVVDAADSGSDATSTRDFGLDDLTISLATATTSESEEEASTETPEARVATESEESSEWTIEEAEETTPVVSDSDPLLVWRRDTVTERDVMTVDPLSL
ncbi:MAG: beta strand repeat-containing protein, partial [Planctomycetota bacterium]